MENKLKNLLFICILAVQTFGDDVPLPDYIHVCHRSDPNLQDCILKSIENLRPHLVKGIPEIDLPSIDPMYIGDLTLLEKNQNGFSIITKNVYSRGTNNFIIKNFKLIDEKTYEYEIFMPQLNVDGSYDVKGTFLGIPLNGKGPFIANFTNVDCSVKVNMEIKNVDGADRLLVKKLIFDMKVGGGQVKLENLANGDKTLGNAINDALNQNFSALNKELSPLVAKSLQKRFKEISNKITSRFTYDQILPE